MGMVVNPVIVTALFDIGRDEWEKFTMSYDSYLRWMRNTLSIKSNIVVYTEKKMIDKIREMRKEFDPSLKNTIIIEKFIEDIPIYQRYGEKIFNIMYGHETFIKEASWNNVPEMNQPLYNIVMFAKMDFIKESKDNNHFDGDIFVWADAGGLREDIEQYMHQPWPIPFKINQLDKPRPIFFSHNEKFEIPNNRNHCISQVRNIQGTCFMVHKGCVDDFYNEFNQVIIDCLEGNYIGSDEKILDITYLRHKSRYALVKCTWREYYDIFSISNLETKIAYI